MPQIFFTADLHFTHANIIKLCPQFRPAVSHVSEMDEYLIAYWNKTVSSEDIVYNLGDLSFSHHKNHIASILHRLNGEHHLLLGNHDSIIAQNQTHFLNSKKADGKPLLTSISHYHELHLKQHKPLVLFHYPLGEWNGYYKGWTHLHGHLHQRSANLKGRILNVGFDMHGRFLRLADIEQLLDGISAAPIEKNEISLNPDVQSHAWQLRQTIKALNTPSSSTTEKITASALLSHK